VSRLLTPDQLEYSTPLLFNDAAPQKMKLNDVKKIRLEEVEGWIKLISSTGIFSVRLKLSST